MRQLGIFAKYWAAGQVKTRLAKSIGEDAAASFHRSSVATLVCRFRDTADRRVIGFWPGEHQAEFVELAGREWHTEVQVPGNLGVRMAAYFDAAFKAGVQRVVLIGADSPTLPAAHIRDAFTLLSAHQVVLGPADDGGYYLVGASLKTPDIFHEVTWSSRAVWSQTVQRLEASATKWAPLPSWYDVDDLEQLHRLKDQLANGEYDQPVWDDLRRTTRAVLAK